MGLTQIDLEKHSKDRSLINDKIKDGAVNSAKISSEAIFDYHIATNANIQLSKISIPDSSIGLNKISNLNGPGLTIFSNGYLGLDLDNASGLIYDDDPNINPNAKIKINPSKFVVTDSPSTVSTTVTFDKNSYLDINGGFKVLGTEVQRFLNRYTENFEIVTATNEISLTYTPENVLDLSIFINGLLQMNNYSVDSINKKIIFNSTIPAGTSIKVYYYTADSSSSYGMIIGYLSNGGSGWNYTATQNINMNSYGLINVNSIGFMGIGTFYLDGVELAIQGFETIRYHSQGTVREIILDTEDPNSFLTGKVTIIFALNGTGTGAAKGTAVYIDSTGKFKLATNTSENSVAQGILLENAGPYDKARIIIDGIIQNTFINTSSRYIYLGENGVITDQIPTGSGKVVQIIGELVSNNYLWIKPQIVTVTLA